MPRDYLSSLPEEMLDEISEFLQYDDTGDLSLTLEAFEQRSYHALTRTCKSLCAHFQHHFFSNIFLFSERSIRKLAELVQSKPVLASYIRTIDLETDKMCMGFFQYPPLLTIMHAANSSGTSPKIFLWIGARPSYAAILGNDLPSNTITHIFNAPHTILHAITDLKCSYIEPAFQVGLFSLLPNLRLVDGSDFVLSCNDYLAEGHTSQSQFFCPKLDVLVLRRCSPSIFKMLCEEILDLSALKEFEVSFVKTGTTSVDHLNAKRLLAWRILDRAPSVQRLQLDVGVGPFYDLGRLQHLRKCTLEVDANANPLPHLCQLLRTLPPLPEHNLEYLHVSFDFVDIVFDDSEKAGSHVLFSIDTWSNFDAALVNLITSGTRPFKLELDFRTLTPISLTQPLVKILSFDWKRRYLPKSSRQRNLTIDFQHFYSYSAYYSL